MKAKYLQNLSIVLILIISQSIEFPSVFAQTEINPNENLFWVHGGLGRSSLGAIGGSAGLSIQRSKLLFSIRTTGNSEEGGMFEGGDEYSDVGILIGIANRKPKSHASFSVGIARVTGSHYVEYEETMGFVLFSGERVDLSPTIGIPLESQLFYKLSGWLGLGVNIYMNLNNEKTFGGLTLNLMIGKMR